MSKRFPKPLESTAKKPKLDVTFKDVPLSQNKRVNKNNSSNSKNIENNDLWEEIFLDDEQLEEIDFISSQACNDVTIFLYFFDNLVNKINICVKNLFVRIYLEAG